MEDEGDLLLRIFNFKNLKTAKIKVINRLKRLSIRLNLIIAC